MCIRDRIYVDPKRVDEVRGKARPIVFTDILANGVSFTGSSLKYNQNNLTSVSYTYLSQCLA